LLGEDEAGDRGLRVDELISSHTHVSVSWVPVRAHPRHPRRHAAMPHAKKRSTATADGHGALQQLDPWLLGCADAIVFGVVLLLCSASLQPKARRSSLSSCRWILGKRKEGHSFESKTHAGLFSLNNNATCSSRTILDRIAPHDRLVYQFIPFFKLYEFTPIGQVVVCLVLLALEYNILTAGL
jgi:hypothetical protein